jgi:hypothetical protein
MRIYVERDGFCTKAVVLAAILMLACSACTSKPKPNGSSTAAASPAATNSHPDNQFDGGTYCVQTSLQGPPPSQPLHFSNQVVESDASAKSKDFQADFSGDNVDLVQRDKWLATAEDRQFFQDSQKFTDPKVTRTINNNGIAEETTTNHAVRSDQVGWRGVVVSVAQGGTPWKLFVSRPTVNRVGAENVNGFDTIKYAVDTTHDSQVDKAALMSFSQLKDYNITGTAWVLKDANCVLQYNIDFEQDGKDGKVSKTHYEGTITKK